jgi:hypothetical protein
MNSVQLRPDLFWGNDEIHTRVNIKNMYASVETLK